MNWTDVPKIRELTFVTRSCEWSNHIWERFETDYDRHHNDRLVIAVLCLTCGRDLAEAIGALPIVSLPAEYPELKKGVVR